jgi:hypothetical protein
MGEPALPALHAAFSSTATFFTVFRELLAACWGPSAFVMLLFEAITGNLIQLTAAAVFVVTRAWPLQCMLHCDSNANVRTSTHGRGVLLHSNGRCGQAVPLSCLNLKATRQVT